MLKIWPIFITKRIIRMHPEVICIYILGNALPQKQSIALGCLLGVNISETLCSKLSEKGKLSKNLPNNDKDWGSYLAGLIEGDGYFSSEKKK
jgi:hypothetical protein